MAEKSTTREKTAPEPVQFTSPDQFSILEYSGSGDVTGTVVRVPGLGCTAGDVPAGNVGQVAVINRGTCSFREKVDAATAQGYGAVVTCGWSMGGAAVLRHAGLRGTVVAGQRLSSPPDAVVAVSTASRWSVRSTATGPMRRLHRVIETRSGRAYARRVMRTRISDAGWDPLPAAPVDLVGRVAPLPLLLVLAWGSPPPQPTPQVSSPQAGRSQAEQ